MKSKIIKHILAVLCVIVLVGCPGCGAGQTGNSGGANDALGNRETPAAQDSGPPEDSPAGQLYAKAVMSGSVVEFSKQGCVISPVEYADADGGSLAMASVPGHEDPAKNVDIQYAQNCKFQIAVIDPATGAADLTDVTAADVKKQSSLIIQGSVQDDHHVTATLVTIARYQSI